jgi:hypothetical protein
MIEGVLRAAWAGDMFARKARDGGACGEHLDGLDGLMGRDGRMGSGLGVVEWRGGAGGDVEAR